MKKLVLVGLLVLGVVANVMASGSDPFSKEALEALRSRQELAGGECQGDLMDWDGISVPAECGRDSLDSAFTAVMSDEGNGPFGISNSQQLKAQCELQRLVTRCTAINEALAKKAPKREQKKKFSSLNFYPVVGSTTCGFWGISAYGKKTVFKGFSRDFDIKDPLVWDEFVAAEAKQRINGKTSPQNNPVLLIDAKAGTDIPLSELASYDDFQRVTKRHAGSEAEITEAMRGLGLTDCINYLCAQSRKVVVFTSPTAFSTIAFEKSHSLQGVTLKYFMAGPSFMMKTEMENTTPGSADPQFGCVMQ